MAFDAKAELFKHGWKEGKGLGKKEDGMKESIKVNIKKSRSGVGHNVADEFSYHWWDHVFNQAANNIRVTNAENCVKFDVTNSNLQVDRHKRHSPVSSDRRHLYGNFIKSATLTYDDDSDAVREVSVSRSPTECSADLSSPTSTLNDDLLNRRSGLTGHRAARHGHQMSGKLARLAQQEAAQSSTQVSRVSTVVSTSVIEGRRHKHDKSQKKKKKKIKLKRTGTEQS